MTKKWVQRQAKDIFVKRKGESKLFKEYYARSAFKLIEMNEKYKLFKPNMKVVDFGCAPGSWSQVLVEQKCNVVGYDLLDCKLVHPSFIFYKKDILKIESNLNCDFIVSDMSPNLSGNKIRDISNNIELNLMLLSHIQSNTKGLICKAFASPLQNEFEAQLKLSFNKIHKFKPKSSRSESTEYYYVAKRVGH